MNNKVEINQNSIFINQIEYVPKSSQTQGKQSIKGLPFVIIRTYSAGVHMGYLKAKESTLAGMEVELIESRRLYSWSGALTISELALLGTSKPDQCKFTCILPSIFLVAIEIVPVVEEAFKSLTSVKIWKQ